MKKFQSWRWWTVALRGVAALLLGVLSIWAPGVAFMALVVLFGVYAIVDGALALGLTSQVPRPMRYTLIFRGAISIGAGVLALLIPEITAVALLMVIATWAVISGLLEIMLAIRIRREVEGEWLLALEGVLSVVFGVMLFIAPLAGAVVLGLWVGAYALVLGGMLLGTAFRMRRTMREPPAMAAA